LLRRALPERSVKIHARAPAIGAGQLAINEDRHASFSTAGTDLVLWNQRIDQRHDDRRLGRREEPIVVSRLAGQRRGVRMRMRCRLCLGFLNRGWSCGRNDASHRPGDAKAFQDIASAHAFIVSHNILPR
jgi:hypothetical protein